MKVIYLDQNQWIALARVYHGRVNDPAERLALDRLCEIVEAELAVVPLSSAHYLETSRITDPERRVRLGTVMWEISRGATIASHHDFLCHELECALAERFTAVIPRPFDLISHGAGHAFGMPDYHYRLPPQLREKMDTDRVSALESTLTKLLERSLITGESPDGHFASPYRVDTYRNNFAEHLSKIRPTLLDLPKTQWDDALNAMSLVDVRLPVTEVLARHNLDWSDLLGLGKEELTRFMSDIPTRSVDMHLHRQVLRNPQYRPKSNDLEDWSALGMAAAACDALVCEKHMADMLRRDGFRPKAIVLRRLAGLPTVLDTLLS